MSGLKKIAKKQLAKLTAPPPAAGQPPAMGVGKKKKAAAARKAGGGAAPAANSYAANLGARRPSRGSADGPRDTLSRGRGGLRLSRRGGSRRSDSSIGGGRRGRWKKQDAGRTPQRLIRGR